MNYANGRRLADDIVLNDKVNRQYTLVFGESSINDFTHSSIIPVKNRREVELLLLSLGEEADVFMDNHARKSYPEVWDWLFGRTYPEVLGDLRWTCREENEVVDLIQRIPLPRIFSDNLNGVHKNDWQSERIRQDFVHKIHKENVLISKPYQCGKMFYFRVFRSSLEFNIDHESDHLEGILIFEAARQASIAAAHLAGLPVSSPLMDLKAVVQYKKFVEYREPFLIGTIPVYKQSGGEGYCVFHIIQNGKSCVDGYFNAIAYNPKKYLSCI